MTNGNYLDHLILKALREDDEKALSHLFESQYNRLFRTGLKLGADSELVKESIQAVFKDLWQYRHTLSDIQSFEAYLKTALKRRIFKDIKKQQNNKTTTNYCRIIFHIRICNMGKRDFNSIFQTVFWFV